MFDALFKQWFRVSVDICVSFQSMIYALAANTYAGLHMVFSLLFTYWNKNVLSDNVILFT